MIGSMNTAADDAWLRFLSSTPEEEITTLDTLVAAMTVAAHAKGSTVDEMWAVLDELYEDSVERHVEFAHSVLHYATEYRLSNDMPAVEIPPMDDLLSSIQDVLDAESEGRDPGVRMGKVEREAFGLRRAQEDRDLYAKAVELRSE